MQERETSAGEMFRPAVTKRASEIIYEQIKERIIKGELQPGDRLPSERNMMEMFQRSRPTIREALRMLERSGYIRTVAGSNGAIVMLPDEENMQQSIMDALSVGQIELKDVGEYRLVSEVATAAWAAERADGEDIAELERFLERAAALMGSYVEFIALDSQFHALLARASKNRVSLLMNKTFSQLSFPLVKEKMDSVAESKRAEMCRRIQAQHTAIFDAVRAHDAERARCAMIEHIGSFEADLS